jgi:hypothetical protein
MTLLVFLLNMTPGLARDGVWSGNPVEKGGRSPQQERASGLPRS